MAGTVNPAKISVFHESGKQGTEWLKTRMPAATGSRR